MAARHDNKQENNMDRIIINGIDVTKYRTVSVPSHVELTIRYATGEIKTINYSEGLAAKGGPQVRTLAGSLLAQVKAAYKGAGHEVIEVNNVERTQAQLAEIAAQIAADRADADYRRHVNAVMGMSAGGEVHDQI